MRSNFQSNRKVLHIGVYVIALIFFSEILFSWVEIYGYRIKAIILLLILISLFIRFTVSPKKLAHYIKVPTPFLVFVVILSILVLITNVYNDVSPFDVLRFFSFILPSILIPYFIKDYRSLYKIMNLILLSLCFSVLFSFLQLFFGETFIPYYHLPKNIVAATGHTFSLEFRERMPGLSITGLHQSYLLSCFLPMLVAFINIHFKKTMAKYTIILFLMTGLVFTFTRTAIFLGIGTSIIVFLLYKRGKFQYFILTSLTVFLLFFLFMNFSGKNYERFTFSGINHNINNRLALILYGFQVGWDSNFWFGNKHLDKDSLIFDRTYANMAPRKVPLLGELFPSRIDYPHNIFADTLIKYGFVFLVFTVLLFLYLIYIYRKTISYPYLTAENRYMLRGVLFSFFAFAGSAFFHNIDITSDFNFWLLTGILLTFHNLVIGTTKKRLNK